VAPLSDVNSNQGFMLITRL